MYRRLEVNTQASMKNNLVTVCKRSLLSCVVKISAHQGVGWGAEGGVGQLPHNVFGWELFWNLYFLRKLSFPSAFNFCRMTLSEVRRLPKKRMK